MKLSKYNKQPILSTDYQKYRSLLIAEPVPNQNNMNNNNAAPLQL